MESLGIVAGGIAHDFNNLLTAIVGNISLAKMRLGPSSPASDLLDGAEAASVRAQGLTQQLLTFSKGGAPIRTVTSLARLVEETTRFSITGSNVKAFFELAPDLWPVNIDPNQISQVIQNLVINADQAMPTGGYITIKAENKHVDGKEKLALDPGDYVALSVIDQGQGISQEILDRIFDPYFSTKQKGSGLGLATAFSIVRRHGGTIEVSSTLGKGSVFTVYLPAVPGAVDDVETMEEEQGEFVGHGRVLVMDDEDPVRLLCAEALRSLGYEPGEARDGEEAIEKYRQAKEEGRPFDAVIMDLTIAGGMGGVETVKKILELDPHARVVVSSGYASDPVMAQYADFGFSAVLPKPYRIDQLKDVLGRLLYRKG